MRGRAVAAGLLAALLIGCSGAPDASESSGTPSPSASVAPSPIEVPSASPSPAATDQPRPSTSPSEAPSSPPTDAGPRWELLAEGLPEQIAPNVVAFDAGYIIFEFGLEIWFSEDGVAWELVSLPSSEPQCEGEETELIERAATDGHSVILLGAFTTLDCRLQTMAWVTDDGREWRRSQNFGDPRRFSEAEPVDVWAVPGGWEAAIAFYDPTDPASDGTTIWHSADGLTWTQTATVAGFGSVDGAADASGNRVLSVTGHITTAFGSPASQERLVTSADGVTWTHLDAQFNRSADVAVVSALEPPTGDRSMWVLFVAEYEQQVSSDDSFTGGTLWLSSDLSQWEPVSPPKVRTFPEAATSEGLIATACNRLREECAMHITLDGREWTPIISEFPPDKVLWVAEGPAGVLAATDEGAVYLLRP